MNGGNPLRCEYCGATIDLPFHCTYCGKYLCEVHRLLENHSCPNAPPRTPLGSYQSKVSIDNAAKAQTKEIPIPNLSVTYDNKHGYRFNVPPEVYLDEEYYNKLNDARTLDNVEQIIQDYYKHQTRKD